MNYQYKEEFVFWCHIKEIINTALGLGFGYDHPRALEVYSEIDEDFGVPTLQDLDEFREQIESLPADTSKQDKAKQICKNTLDLYALLA